VEVFAMTKKTLVYLLENNQIRAIKKLKKELEKQYHIYDMAIFGSVARQEDDEESDLDLFIIIKEKATHETRNNISDIVFEINLEYESNISIIIMQKEDWNKGFTKITPFYNEIKKDGVFINEYL